MSIIKLVPNGGHASMATKSLGGLFMQNNGPKTIYIRVGLASIKVSDRKPAPYGAKKIGSGKC